MKKSLYILEKKRKNGVTMMTFPGKRIQWNFTLNENKGDSGRRTSQVNEHGMNFNACAHAYKDACAYFH